MKIAVMPGDFVGKEVVAEGLKVLRQVSQKFNFTVGALSLLAAAALFLLFVK